MYCQKCGNEISEGEKYCTNCGNYIHDDNNGQFQSQDSIQQEESKIQNINQEIQLPNAEDEKKANLLCTISLLCTYGSNILSYIIIKIANESPNFTNLIYEVLGSLPLIGLILMIIARIKYPQNRFAKVLMWVYIINAIIGVIAFILIFLWCLYTIESCKGTEFGMIIP